MAGKINSHKKTEYSVTLGSWRGVDRDGVTISPTRLACSENMYRDYDGDGGGVIESIPGFRRLCSLGKRVKKIYRHKNSLDPNCIVVHAEDALYSFSRDILDNLDSMQPRGTVGSSASAGFCFGDDFYLLDGENIHTLNRYNYFNTVTASDSRIYIPTAYINGEEYEQRNLLTDKFKEEYTVSDPNRYSYGSPELIYSVTDPDKLWCSVTGLQAGFQGVLYIPKYATVGGVSYEVRGIADKAFESQYTITEVIIADGLRTIGNESFYNCASLKKAVIPDSVTSIGDMAFSSCISLETFYLGSGLKEISDSAFRASYKLKVINFSGGATDFSKIEGVSVFADMTVYCPVRYGKIYACLRVNPYASAIERVTLDGADIDYEILNENGRISALLLTLPEDWNPLGRKVVINGVYSSGASSGSKKNKSFPETATGKKQSGFLAITKCTVAVLFDGRIFYSGNPELPNTVFYSERDSTGENNPLYVGAMNYFNDGLGAYHVTSLLPVRDSLAVFKGGDDGGGSIFYHTPLETGDSIVPKAYPVAYVHSGLSAFGPSVSFLDDPVFLSPSGLSALTEKNISYERSIACRSHNVNFDLLKEDLASATLAIWQGYLAICTRGKIFLADSRATFRHETGNTEYEWFILTGIGCYKYDACVFRYDSIAPDGFSVHPNCDGKVSSTIYSDYINGSLVYYTFEDGVNYATYPTSEWEGGSFSPAVCIASVGELLLFATERGELCVFNNDKKGVAPDYVSASDGFDADEYKERMGTRLHPDFYYFDRHTPRYLITTGLHNCGIPHLSKNTVKGSLVVKCKSLSGNKMHLEVATDKTGYREVATFTGSGLDFSSLDFSLLSFDHSDYANIPFREREKDWVEKQITLYSEAPASPIGILSVSYRFTLRGNIKER